MPESRPRKKADYKPPTPARRPAGMGGRRWIAPMMVGLWVIGLAWIVVFYLAGNDVEFLNKIGNWNLVIGMGFIAAGFIFATKWE